MNCAHGWMVALLLSSAVGGCKERTKEPATQAAKPGKKSGQVPVSPIPKGFEALRVPMERAAVLAVIEEKRWSRTVWVDVGAHIDEVAANSAAISSSVARGFAESQRLNPGLAAVVQLTLEKVLGWDRVEISFDNDRPIYGESTWSTLDSLRFSAKFDLSLYDMFVSESKAKFGDKVEVDDEPTEDCTVARSTRWGLCQQQLTYVVTASNCGDGHVETGVHVDVFVMDEPCDVGDQQPKTPSL